MGKKIIKKKTAAFTLEPDGFSIHTFELSRRLTAFEYRKIKEYLYDLADKQNKRQQMYTVEKGRHFCLLFKEHGVRVMLEHNSVKKGVTHYVRIVVNPRKLIDPESSYIGILPSMKSSVEEVREAFREHLGEVFLRMTSATIL